MSVEPIDVADLMGAPGSSRDLRFEGTLEELSAELADIARPVHGRLCAESIVEGIFLTGTVAGVWSLLCARCLTAFERPFEVALAEMFVVEPDPDGDDYPLAPEGLLEPEQAIRDAVGLEMPFSPLCRPDCRGLCPVCGGDRNRGECPGDHVSIDPRWEGLEQVLDRLDS